MNDLVSLVEIAVLAYVFISAWELKEDIRKHRKDQDLLFERITELYASLDHLYRMLTRLQEDQRKNEQ